LRGGAGIAVPAPRPDQGPLCLMAALGDVKTPPSGRAVRARHVRRFLVAIAIQPQVRTQCAKRAVVLEIFGLATADRVGVVEPHRQDRWPLPRLTGAAPEV